MRCRSCNVLNMHALGKRVTQISMNARAVAGVNEVNCLGMLGCGMWGQLLIGAGHAPELGVSVVGPACSPARGCVGVCRSDSQGSTLTRETHTPPNVGNGVHIVMWASRVGLHVQRVRCACYSLITEQSLIGCWESIPCGRLRLKLKRVAAEASGCS